VTGRTVAQHKGSEGSVVFMASNHVSVYIVGGRGENIKKTSSLGKLSETKTPAAESKIYVSKKEKRDSNA